MQFVFLPFFFSIEEFKMFFSKKNDASSVVSDGGIFTGFKKFAERLKEVSVE